MTEKPISSSLPLIQVALPAMNEWGYLQDTIRCLQNQDIENYRVWICVNQPEDYRSKPEKKDIIESNKKSLEWLQSLQWNKLHLIDRCSPGKGWTGKSTGVGMARKTIMDAIAQEAKETDIILCLDADTRFEKGYLRSVAQIFQSHPQAMGLANPYYHKLTEDEKINRAILRYEIYMRYYARNLNYTGTPFHFTPLGSAMAAPVWAYKKIGGLTPKKSGEDFYFLQKLTKSGSIIMHNTECVYPAARLSDRVVFGTGPAVIKGVQGLWHHYPLFALTHFEKIKQTIDLFPKLYHQKLETPMDNYISENFKEEDIFEPLRKNNPDKNRFIKACHEKLDGLRLLQFLKICHRDEPGTDEENFREFMNHFYAGELKEIDLNTIDFSSCSIEILDKIRIFLFEKEGGKY